VAQHAIFERDFPHSLQFAVDHVQRALDMIGTSAADSLSRQAVGHLLAHLAHHSAEIVLHSLQAAMDWIAAALTFQVGMTDVHSPLETVLAARAGICQITISVRRIAMS
jgi:uncharacterized alpha-E superfamily protein